MNKIAKANHPARNENRKRTADDYSERVDYKKTTLAKLLTEAIAKYNDGCYQEAEYLFGVARPHWDRLQKFAGWTDVTFSRWLSNLAKLSQYKPDSWELKNNNPVVPYQFEFKHITEVHTGFLKRRFAEVITSRQRLDELCQKYGIPVIVNADVAAHTWDDKAKAVWGTRKLAIRSKVLFSGDYNTQIGTVNESGMVPVVVELPVTGIGTIKAEVKGFKISDERRCGAFKCESMPSWNIISGAFNQPVADYLPAHQKEDLLKKVKTRSLRDHRYSVLEEILNCQEWKHLQENDYPKLRIILAEVKTRLTKEDFVPGTEKERYKIHNEAYGKYVLVPSKHNYWLHWDGTPLSDEERKTYMRGNCSSLELAQAIQSENTEFIYELLQIYLDRCERVGGYIQAVSEQKLEPPKSKLDHMTALRYSTGHLGYKQPKDTITEAEHAALEEQINAFLRQLYPVVTETRDINERFSPNENTEPKEEDQENMPNTKMHWHQFYAYDPSNISPSMMDREVKSTSSTTLPPGKKLLLVCSIQGITEVDTSNVYALNLFNSDDGERALLSDDDLVNLPALPQLEVFKSPRSCLTAKGVAIIVERCPQLKVLDVTVPNVSTDCLQSIAGLKNLEVLDLSSGAMLALRGDLKVDNIDPIGDITQLSPLKHLRDFRLRDYYLSDANLEAFAALPALEEAYLTVSGQRNKSAATLPQSQTLRKLDLDWRTLDDACGHSLDGLPNIEELRLISRKIGDAFIAKLKGREKLTTLSLFDSKVTGLGLDQLGLLPNLKDLDVRHTHITEADIERCLPNFPNLATIAYSGPVDEVVPAFLVSKRIKACVQGSFWRNPSCDCHVCAPLNEKENAEALDKLSQLLQQKSAAVD